MNCHLVCGHEINGFYDINLAIVGPLGSCNSPSAIALHPSRGITHQNSKRLATPGVHGEFLAWKRRRTHGTTVRKVMDIDEPQATKFVRVMSCNTNLQ